MVPSHQSFQLVAVENYRLFKRRQDNPSARNFFVNLVEDKLYMKIVAFI
jgi:hypothetical protein